VSILLSEAAASQSRDPAVGDAVTAVVVVEAELEAAADVPAGALESVVGAAAAAAEVLAAVVVVVVVVVVVAAAAAAAAAAAIVVVVVVAAAAATAAAAPVNVLGAAFGDSAHFDDDEDHVEYGVARASRRALRRALRSSITMRSCSSLPRVA